MKKILSALLLAVCVNVPSACRSQTETNGTSAGNTNASFHVDADGRVADLLRAKHTPFLIDENGDFDILYGSSDDRVQHVSINSATSAFEKIEVRDIYSVAYTSDEPFTGEFTERLLERNAVILMGGWSVHKQKGQYLLVFSVRVDAADQKADSLDAIIDLVAITARGMSDEIKKAMVSKTNIWSPFDKPKGQL